MNGYACTLRGEEWTIRFVRGPLFVKREPVYGYTYWDKREIRIDHSLRGAILVDTLIHEIDHVMYPDIREEIVNERGTVLTSILSDLELLADA